MPNQPLSILTKWGITESALTTLVDQNPSLRGMMLGYVAETKFQEMFLDHPAITATYKDDDHDRSQKGDRRIVYKGRTLAVEVKSLQTASIRKTGGGHWEGRAQVDDGFGMARN